MAEKAVTRIIVCVDDSDYNEDGTLGHGNESNIFRLKNIVATGTTTVDPQGRYVNQHVRYHQAVQDSGSLLSRFGGRQDSSSVDQQVKYIVQDICERSQGTRAELFLYGSGRGAYIIQAAASLIHSIGIPKSMHNFAQLYQVAVELERAFKNNDSLGGTKLMTYLKSHGSDPPNIRFLGVFDSLKTAVETYEYEPSFVGSIQIFRHALAFNDVQTTPYTWDTPPDDEMMNRSFIQAWFMGTHRDICGGSEHDGLSLYPFQWMLLESMKAGLVLRTDSGRTGILSLAFPQFAGNLPTFADDEKAHWRLKYINGIELSMFDLQSVDVKSKKASDHSVRFKTGGSARGMRKIFTSNSGLVGWTEDHAYGSIIHPAMFTMLDRNPRFYDQGVFKAKKGELSAYLECIDDQGKTAPWLEGMELQASGVKAFRILVCGKTGVGKSTLINKVFGVEMTEESTTYSQGVHDINQAFESANHPGLLIHDSRGWQAGSDTELDLIAKFLRHRAFQKNPAEALHVIWFCVDSDVSRIEEADRRTFQIISQFSSSVPVFVVGTKKDKLVAFRKMELLEQYMEKTGNFKEASRLAQQEASDAADAQFLELRNQLSNLEHYKADGYCCISKDDDTGVKTLLNDTLDLLSDDRVRVFCVAAQVMDVEQKIDQAITEVMRLGAHAIRTAMVPLPASGLIGTPTVSRILCEHVLQCFGFPKATPEAVEEVMSRVVMKNLRSFMKVSLTHFGVVSAAAIGTAVPTAGIGILVGLAGCILATPPTARMLMKCAADMILILERSFRYQGRYVSVKQIEDAAAYYTTAKTKSLAGKPILLQEHVHAQLDNMIPLKRFGVGFKFGKLRQGLQDVIYMNRYDKSEGSNPASRTTSYHVSSTTNLTMTSTNTSTPPLPSTPTPDGGSSPVPNTWGDWKHDTTLSPPAPPQGPIKRKSVGSPQPSLSPRTSHPNNLAELPPEDRELNMKYMGVPPGAMPVAELDSTTVRSLPAELEGMSLRDSNQHVSELPGDYGLPGQTHPDYAPSIRRGPRAPTMQLEGTLYTPVDPPLAHHSQTFPPAQAPAHAPTPLQKAGSSPSLDRITDYHTQAIGKLSASAADLAMRTVSSSNLAMDKMNSTGAEIATWTRSSSSLAVDRTADLALKTKESTSDLATKTKSSSSNFMKKSKSIFGFKKSSS
ncbi:hypothetical protein F5Y18DRAFT_35462 [Xylariaceae sp. FL1019]|nr:hypothetical protein F5Y18DRAFT_35462 [Xylariaceae sp. FL1019]